MDTRRIMLAITAGEPGIRTLGRTRAATKKIAT